MEESVRAISMLVRCASLLWCLMKYKPTQSAIAHNPFRSALRAGKNIQRPAKLAEAWCTYSSQSRNDTARPLTTTIAPTTGRGLISACSMLTIKSQKSIPKSSQCPPQERQHGFRAGNSGGGLLVVTSEQLVVNEGIGQIKSLFWRALLFFGPLSDRKMWTTPFRSFAEGQLFSLLQSALWWAAEMIENLIAP